MEQQSEENCWGILGQLKSKRDKLNQHGTEKKWKDSSLRIRHINTTPHLMNLTRKEFMEWIPAHCYSILHTRTDG